ncbi:MAG: mechanosensitive ion channel family protein [Stomatobaculum sp.]|nr:mechanosensitive ion channel family protein [Stomatobaculum sp.]
MTEQAAAVTEQILSEAGVPKASVLMEQMRLLQTAAVTGVLRVAAVLVVFLLGRMIIRHIIRGFRAALERNRSIDKGMEQFLLSAVRFVLYAFLIMAILTVLGVPSASVAAAIASAGLAVGMALQGSLSNLAGGIILLYTRPFVVGDYVKTSGGEGFVQDIGLIYTVLRQFDNTAVSVPNSTLTNGVITNCTARNERRISFDVGIGYGADIDKARSVILDVIRNHTETDQDKVPAVAVTDLQDSAVNLSVLVWVKDMAYGDQLGLRNTLREEVKKRLDAEGVEIPFPQMDVHIK